MVYFDHNATTPLLPEARQAWLQGADQFPGNPSSPHRLGSRAEAALQQARQTLANHLKCDPLDLVWTSGATESNNMVFHHAARTLPLDAQVWVSTVEHPCVLAAAAHYFPGRHHLIPVDRSGLVDLDWLATRLSARRPGLVAVMAANNETGVLQPWRALSSLCQERSVPYFCDAAQWLGKLPGDGLGACDFVSGCAHKFGGPRGVGFLKCAGQGRIIPLLLGGPQEDGRRAGTENVPAVLSLVSALVACQGRRSTNTERLAWRTRFEREFLKTLPGGDVVAQRAERLWNTVSALMPDAHSQHRWVVKLDKLGFAVSTGSACASGKEQPSHVLLAMGRSPSEAGRVLRFSSGWETTESDWQALLQALEQVRDTLQPHAER